MTNQSAPVPEVTVDESYSTLRRYGREILGHKYVVVRVNGRRVVWAPDARADGHKELVVRLEDWLGQEVHALGGGAIYIDHTDKKVYLWDYSASYGHDDKHQTAKALQPHYPEYLIVFYRPGEEPFSIPGVDV